MTYVTDQFQLCFGFALPT